MLLAAATGAAVIAAGLLIAVGVVVGVLLREWFAYLYSIRVHTDGMRAAQEGYQRGLKDGQHARKIDEADLPQTAQEAEDMKSAAESLLDIYPYDPMLKEIQKRERGITPPE